MLNPPTSPTVSILIPTYNYAHHIEEAIRSVLSQTFTDYEVIIVDDKSTDKTDEIVQQFLGDKRFTYYKNQVNFGLVGNFNKCLEYANGKYIKYLLADDRLGERLLEKFVPVMEANESISLITSYSEMFGIKQKIRKLPFEGLVSGRKVIYECLHEGRGNWIGEPTTVMFRKSSLDSGHFSNKYICLVDLNMWLRLLMKGDCYIVPEVLSYFRHHPKQASSKTNVQNWIDEYTFYRDIKQLNLFELNQSDLNSLNLDHVIHDRAINCAKGMFRILHRISEPRQRSLIKKTFRIAVREKVLLNGMFEMVRKHSPFQKKATKKVSDAASIP